MILPSGYKRLLYIESSGTQYVDTGWKPKYNSRVVVDVSGISTEAQMVFGTRNTASGTSPSQFALYMNSATTVRYYYFGTNKDASVSDASAKTTINANANTVNWGAVSITNTAVSSGECSYPLYLFALNNVGSPSGIGSFKLYSCKTYDGATLTRNFIPCQTDTGEIGLYDTVGGQFYGNKGTGVFIAGPEWGYVELEYIESSGTQYVDTGFVPNQDSRVVCDAQFTAISGTIAILGERPANSVQNAFAWISVSGNLRSYNNTEYSVVASSNIERHTYDLNKNVTSIDGNVLISRTYTSFTGVAPIFIFASNDGGTAAFLSKMRLYSSKFYDNGTLVRDYIPVKLIDGTVGLLDNVSGLFYGNAGTGNFIAGPEIPEVVARTVSVDLIPPESGQKIKNFDVSYIVTDDIESESFEAVEMIDGTELQTVTVNAGEVTTTTIASEDMDDGLHAFSVMIDGQVAVEYTFYVNNSGIVISITDIQLEMPTSVTVNEKFKISVTVSENGSMIIGKLIIHAGDIYAGEV